MISNNKPPENPSNLCYASTGNELKVKAKLETESNSDSNSDSEDTEGPEEGFDNDEDSLAKVNFFMTSYVIKWPSDLLNNTTPTTFLNYVNQSLFCGKILSPVFCCSNFSATQI